MARVKVTADNFAAVINQLLDEYEADTEKTTAEVVKEVTQDGVKALKSASGIFNGTKYKSGWTSKVETGRLYTTGVIYNGKLPGLPHLLEYGHVTRNGTGRTYAPTPAHAHIAPVEKELVETFEREVVAKL